MTKKQWEQIIGHIIRTDTYMLLDRITSNKEKYENVVKDIESNREKYGIKKDIIITSKTTITKYLKIFEEYNKTKDKEIDYNKATGIYGIYVNNRLVYVGQTRDSFKSRFQEHKTSLNNSTSYLYNYLRVCKEGGAEISLKPLIIVEELKISKGEKIKERDLKMMELALIDLYKPVCNIQGRLETYYI